MYTIYNRKHIYEKALNKFAMYVWTNFRTQYTEFQYPWEIIFFHINLNI